MATKRGSEAAQAFGQRVRDRRHALGKTQEQVAADAGIHWSYIGQIERGIRNLTLDNILKLAVGLQIDPGELVKGLRPSANEDA
ncbi:helix-turn-helix transcriptional regulator [Frankia sp. AgB1.9]|uniref:helix-turn-helix domain-containing protein n=1 Tax=unclassified Frankia TaxID=2632575 RepID=UPI001933A139|nr:MULTISPECIES: helix-turn-helix transcriptional regulator [unclassified Frankia]MBL7491553.1 helix-turn-helix transcriptional regulator [Frankia sp. AgW1.1]MBL7553806.1 helix-turn-helix transcriptional regulator [Frankia sp. AgB1.9]MBL7617906.1 helix-turn-helix transcriptional regulator [Frankia sp. AgB1.8]